MKLRSIAAVAVLALADVEADGERAAVEEVVVAAEVVAIEDLGGGVLAEEGVWAGVGVGVADANGDGVEIEDVYKRQGLRSGVSVTFF